MKYIVLAAGKGIDSFSEEKNLPKCLLKFDNKTVIDNILEIANDLNLSDINIIGGYEILKIMNKYPSLKYFYNEKWDNTNSLYSLSKTNASAPQTCFNHVHIFYFLLFLFRR